MSPTRSRRAASATTPSSSATSCPNCRASPRDFDRLVHELRRVSREIRQSAEDNAHSFKTPLAAIQSALAPGAPRRARGRSARTTRARDRRFVAGAPARPRERRPAPRHQHGRPDRRAARADRPRARSSRTRRGTSARSSPAATSAWSVRLDRGAVVRTATGMLEIVLQNVLENAISFSPAGTHDHRYR